MSRRKSVVLVAAIVGLYLVASNLEWNDYNMLQEARYNRCVIRYNRCVASKAPSTDMEAVEAIEACAAKTGFKPTKEVYP